MINFTTRNIGDVWQESLGLGLGLGFELVLRLELEIGTFGENLKRLLFVLEKF